MTTESETLEFTYEIRMGEWVASRCRKRAEDHGIPMPAEVKDWLDNGGNSPANENTPPTALVMGWVVKTIEDPDWPEQ